MPKGQVPWNKGLTKDIDARVAAIAKAKTGKPGWNKGLTAKTDARIASNVKARTGQKRTFEQCTSISRGHYKAHHDDPTYATRVGERISQAYRDDHTVGEGLGVSLMLAHDRFQGTREEAAEFIRLKRKHPLYLKHFGSMHARCSGGYTTIDSEFSWTVEGFQNFIDYVGPYPHYMIKPSIGRDNHDLGYIRGNFSWQEFSENILESAIRNKLGIKIKR